jgi:hypothetical protein
MDRLEALKTIIARLKALDDDMEVDGYLMSAVLTVEAMIKEVEAIPNVVQHAVSVLHGAGAVPLVWGNAADMLSDDADPNKTHTEEELREAALKLSTAWDNNVSDDLDGLVAETLQVIVATA